MLPRRKRLDNIPIVVTPSRIELGQRCHRRHVLGDALQRTRYKSPSLGFGSVIHAGTGEWWPSGDVLLAYSALAGEYKHQFDQNPQQELTLALANSMLAEYMVKANLAGPFGSDGWQLVSTEDRLEVPLKLPDGDLATLSFQTDRVVWNGKTEHLVVVDTKTAGRFDKKWMRQWETSLQMKLYKAGVAKVYDIDPENIDIVIEGVLKDVPSRIQYVVCPEWSEGLLNEAVEQAARLAIRDKIALTASDPEEYAVNRTDFNYQSCFEYGVECQFRRLCTADPNQRVALLRSEYHKVAEEDRGY